MSLSLGQYRKSSSTDYLQSMSYTADTYVHTKNNIQQIDQKITLNNSEKFSAENNYYLNVSISSESIQTVYIYLGTSTSDNSQKIGAIEVPIGTDVSFELTFSPANSTYSVIYFMIQRVSSVDQSTITINTASDKLILRTIYNVLNAIKHSTLTKLGVQGPSGLLMCINGEPIRIGKSGIYEIFLDYNITFLGFIISSDSTDYFIVDYQY